MNDWITKYRFFAEINRNIAYPANLAINETPEEPFKEG